MSNSKLTVPQAEILRRLAAGDTLISDGGRYVWASTVPAATIRALRDRGLIVGDSNFSDASYTITDNGRAAIAQETAGKETAT